jgi:hypothetical protein
VIRGAASPDCFWRGACDHARSNPTSRGRPSEGPCAQPSSLPRKACHNMWPLRDLTVYSLTSSRTTALLFSGAPGLCNAKRAICYRVRAHGYLTMSVHASSWLSKYPITVEVPKKKACHIVRVTSSTQYGRAPFQTLCSFTNELWVLAKLDHMKHSFDLLLLVSGARGRRAIDFFSARSACAWVASVYT